MGRHDMFSRFAPRPSRLRFAVTRTAVLVLVLVVLGWIAVSILIAPPPRSEPLQTVPLVEDHSAAPSSDPGRTPGLDPGQLLVHVVGEVQNPGVYRLPLEARVADAVQAAGGATKAGRPDLVNLAAKLADGQQILIPGEPPTDAPAAGPERATGPGGKISLNTADAQTLQQLPGIGPSLAERIIEFRTANGPFTSVEELDAVSGIGPKVLGDIGPLVEP